MVFKPEVRYEWCCSCPGMNPVGNKLDMWSLGLIIWLAVLTCQKGSIINRHMTQCHKTVCILEVVIRGGGVECNEKTLTLLVLTSYICGLVVWWFRAGWHLEL